MYDLKHILLCLFKLVAVFRRFDGFYIYLLPMPRL